MAAQDSRLTAITPAMREGSDLIAFSEQFPERYFDVAIAEQHAITLGAGMACQQMKPVVAIYSTFLQRGYDQLVHDVSIQQLDMLLAIDRAGLVGEDGATHAGCFDIAMLRCLPDTLIMTPADETELRNMLFTGYQYDGLAAVRYPRGTVQTPGPDSMSELAIGKGRLLRWGKKVALLNFGPLLSEATEVAEACDYSLADMRFAKPLDQQLLQQLAETHDLLVSIEDHSILGGGGSAVSEYLHTLQYNTPLLTLGIPDRWIAHGSRQQQLDECGLSVAGISTAITTFLNPDA